MSSAIGFFRRRATTGAPALGPMPRAAALVSLALGVVASLRTHGSGCGEFWCYPAVLFCYCVLPRRLARIGSLTLLLASVAAIGLQAGFDVAAQFGISLGLVIAIVAVMLDALGDMQRTLSEQAITDPLTGAFNRRHMEACLTAALERRARTGEPASILLFDVDHFKHINDTCGHAAGDEVLKALVGLVVGRARRMDALFRIGGEEFVLLLAGAGYADAHAVAEVLLATVANADVFDGRRISISVGVSELERGQSVRRWMEDVDDALYRAKRGGRNQVAGRAAPAAAGEANQQARPHVGGNAAMQPRDPLGILL